jgi:hypothetical protein
MKPKALRGLVLCEAVADNGIDVRLSLGDELDGPRTDLSHPPGEPDLQTATMRSGGWELAHVSTWILHEHDTPANPGGLHCIQKPRRASLREG